MPGKSPPRIVVAGGGVAAFEFVLALLALTADGVHITVVAPNPELNVRPLQLSGVATPALADLAADVGFELVRGSVATVESSRRRVLLRSGGAIAYDTLVLAPGVKSVTAFEDAVHLGLGDIAQPLAALHDEIGRGSVASVAFVAPASTGWLVPAYEAALLTAGRSAALEITLVTPEQHPLETFGPEASTIVAAALRDAGIEFCSGQVAAVELGRLRMLDGRSVAADRVVALPLIRGPMISGVPVTDLLGLIDVDAFGRVAGIPDAYAVGDATAFPVKQAAVACAQADAAAGHVAAHYGHADPAEPFRAELRATLRDHNGELILLNGGQGVGKLPGRHLAPFLQDRSDPASGT